MIWNFKDKETEKVFERRFSKKFPPELQRQMQDKLWILNHAENLHDLRTHPSNHLEKLKGNRNGQYSIRINRQWRICFQWKFDSALDVEITDYH